MQIGWPELLLIIFILILLLGSRKFVEIGGDVGKSLRTIRTDVIGEEKK